MYFFAKDIKINQSNVENDDRIQTKKPGARNRPS